MPDAVTKLLDEADALAAKATEGPWHYCEDEDGGWTVAPGKHEDEKSFVAVQFAEPDDARFSAEARDLVPKLSAMVREMQAALKASSMARAVYLATPGLAFDHEANADDTLRRVEVIAKGETT